MTWFLLKRSLSDVEGGDVITNEVTDRDGNALEGDEIPVAQHEIRKGLPVKSLDTVYVRVNPRVAIGDCLAVSLGTALTISEKAFEAFVKAGCRLHSDIHVFGLIVLSSTTNEERGRYKVLWQLKRPTVLDISRAEVEYRVGGRVIREVKKWAFRENFAAGSDLLQSETLRWLASQRVASVVEEAKLRGFDLEELEQVGKDTHDVAPTARRSEHPDDPVPTELIPLYEFCSTNVIAVCCNCGKGSPLPLAPTPFAKGWRLHQAREMLAAGWIVQDKYEVLCGDCVRKRGRKKGHF